MRATHSILKRSSVLNVVSQPHNPGATSTYANSADLDHATDVTIEGPENFNQTFKDNVTA
jgi:hypothetical protein